MSICKFCKRETPENELRIYNCCENCHVGDKLPYEMGHRLKIRPDGRSKNNKVKDVDQGTLHTGHQ